MNKYNAMEAITPRQTPAAKNIQNMLSREKNHQFRLINPGSLIEELSDSVNRSFEYAIKLHQQDMEALKKTTADQTEQLYLHMSDAKKSYLHLEKQYSEKCGELCIIKHQKVQIQDDLQRTKETTEEIKRENNRLKTERNQKIHHYSSEIIRHKDKNKLLLETVKKKIQHLTHDHEQKLTNMTHEHQFSVMQLSKENKKLRSECAKLSEQTHQALNQYKDFENFNEKQKNLQNELDALTKKNKQQEEKIKDLTESKQLLTNELMRSKAYIEEVEQNNKSIQQELFESWINKRQDEL